MKRERAFKRKLLNFSVNRNMQLRMIAYISGILFVSLLLSSAIFFQFANQEIGSSFQMFHIKARNFLDMLLPVVGISFALSLVCGMAVTLFFPKNYAGALYRIETDLKQVLDNSDLRVKIRLRSGDQAQHLAVQVNDLLADLRERVESAQQALTRLDQLCNADVSLPAEDLQQIRAQLQQHIGTLKV